ncbi:MAG: hypothetical protein CMK09_10415 [Ponticaulis sp.]|nr:hypothetical protein [Ponticaulis sp.]|tara:strand:- start:12639 stop:13649 length:1011 start_codon:yes stop_codon:yes gene_type:complete
MPKLNTFFAAALAATTLLSPANAGEPAYHAGGNVHPGGYAQSGQSHGYAHASGYSSSYSHSSAAYGQTQLAGGSHPLPNYTMSTGGVNVISDNIVCVMADQEVPCDTIPGLAEALRLQGLDSVADQLPVYRGPAGGDPYAGYGYAGVATTGGYASTGYVDAGYAPALTGAVYTRTIPTQTTGSVASTVRSYSQAGPTSSSIYAPTAYSHNAYANQGAEVWVTPCGEVVTRRVVHAPPPCAAPVQRRYVAPAPVSVRLSDGTVYALNGGVGAGIYGEFYGGGGTYISGGSRYSGVLNASASRFTFRERTPRPKTRNPRPKHRYPNPKNRYPGHGGKR